VWPVIQNKICAVTFLLATDDSQYIASDSWAFHPHIIKALMNIERLSRRTGALSLGAIAEHQGAKVKSPVGIAVPPNAVTFTSS